MTWLGSGLVRNITILKLRHVIFHLQCKLAKRKENTGTQWRREGEGGKGCGCLPNVKKMALVILPKFDETKGGS